MLRFDFDTLDSTNSQALQQAARHPGQCVLVTAKVQSAGRGRTGRPWSSPAGGAWLSLAWPVAADAPPQRYAPVPLLVGLGVLQTLEQMLPRPMEGEPSSSSPTRGCGRGKRHVTSRRCACAADNLAERLKIKWPNDVLLDGKKVAGILCERTVGAPLPEGAEHAVSPDRGGAQDLAAGGVGSCLIVGIGINANFDPALLGHDLRYPATTLQAALGGPVDLSELIHRVSRRVESLLQGFEQQGLTAAAVCVIESHLAWRGEEVSLRNGEQELRGRIRGLDQQGRLELEHDGRVDVFAAGEVEQMTLIHA